MNNNKTFVRITNKNIWDELQIIKEHVMATNGKVKLNRWISSSALAIGTFIAGVLIYAKI